MFRTLLKINSLFFILATLLMSLASYADDSDKLYEAEIVFPINNTEQPQAITAVAIDSTEQRQKKLVQQAFVKVLYKLTASESFIKHPAYNELLQASHSLLQKYSYINLAPSANEVNKVVEDKVIAGNKASSLEPKKNEPQLNQQKLNQQRYKIFKAQFNPVDTQQLLAKHNISIWTGIRPETLVWLSLEVNQQRRILSPSIDNQPFLQLQKQAKQRGLTLLFPLLDLEDKGRLSIADLWGDFPNAILAASHRYHSPSVLTIRIFQDTSLFWVANWSLYILDKNIHWQSNDENLNQLLRQGVDSLLPHLADIFKLKNSDKINNKVKLLIHNVTSFTAYKKLENYFKQVAVITDFQLKEIHEDRALYQIKYVGNKKHLLQSLALGDLLQALEKKTTHQTNNTADTEYQAVILTEQMKVETNLTDNEMGNVKPLTATTEVDPKIVNISQTSEQQATSKTETETETETENIADSPIESKVDMFKADLELWLRD